MATNKLAPAKSNPIDIRNGFTSFPNSVFSLDLSANEKLVYIALLSYAWSGRSCHPGRERLTKDTSLSEDTLIRTFKGLVKKGQVIIKRRGRGQTNEYHLPGISAVSVEIKKSQIAVSRSRNLRPLEVANCDHHDHEKDSKEKTQGKGTPSHPPARKRARGEGERSPSKYEYEDCVRYAASLKGIRNAEGFARAISRTGEADKQIEKFLVAEAERAAKEAEAEAERQAERQANLVRMAKEIQANGGARHDWQRKILESVAADAAAGQRSS